MQSSAAQPSASTELGELTVSVWRGAADGRLESFRVPHRTSQTVLDVVTWIQRHLDPTLTYRFACRVGMCGSCAMMVNGAPRWTCRTHVSRVAKDGHLELRPLRNLPVVKDLAADMTEFFDKWRDAYGRFSPTPTADGDFHRVDPESAERKAASAGIECIGCAVCYAACDVVSWNPDYLGPAALNRAWTLINDVRDADRSGHLAAVADDAGCHACHSQGSCTKHCPNGLNPSMAITGLKKSVLGALLRGDL
ncbi:succinate dehydrogenase/fumarate reductase iron-sulfur subunit [Azospirillum sp. RWY-5-1]|uniref:Succinate dehydrogenase iron-sulfur subunit n=1 Tax=Azospirillum oleiclasticum TaxID=2735135 RepID=A0ABX2T6Y3_9PROT|nr:succinate dehydrogenase/fumarate reductase iron-sulfur subunit [Azospirillum oleiclasticum]NYZ20087.1 succinate dehydrogenase/fumarate reductase iron-sulfur subunit [Azospirillum oleiclasticum]